MAVWKNCYSLPWTGLITPESFEHPAKMSRALLVRIFDYLFERGFIERGSVVVDPFSGVATTSIIGATKGVRVFGCELEKKFHELGLANLSLHRRLWELGGHPIPVIVQGDSRKLVEVLGPVMAVACVSSPPYATGTIHRNGIDPLKFANPGRAGNRNQATTMKEYGKSEGQLDRMPCGSVDSVISSPPYSSGQKGHPSLGSTGKDDWGSDGRNIAGRRGVDAAYGDTPGQLGAMANGVIGSPPFEDSMNDNPSSGLLAGSGARMGASCKGDNYGSTIGQIGRETGETFWCAAREIVEQCYLILRPGGVCAWVVKSFVRSGKIVDFPGDWQHLCKSCGFELVERIQASLVKEDAAPSLFGGEDVRKRSRKSFFRRLHEKKRPDLAIDFEEVLILRKP